MESLHPEGLQQAGELGWQEPVEAQQGEVQIPVRGEKQPQAPVHTGGCLAGKQNGWKGPVHPAEHETEHEPAVYPYSSKQS